MRKQRAWILYDWANSAFALTTMAAFFPLLFKNYWSLSSSTETTARLGIGNSIAGLVVALLSPILAELVVVGDRRQRGLMVAALVGIIANGALFVIPRGSWYSALTLFIIARVGFQAANLFYDTLLTAVTYEDERHRVSSVGFAFGYLGCALLFLINMSMVIVPQKWGFADALEGARWSILSVSLWWFIFALPLWRTKIHRNPLQQKHETSLWYRLKKLFLYTLKHKNIAYFLFAYWFYIDGVHSLILMAANYSLALGFPPQTLMIALLVVQIVAFPSAWILGLVAQRIGAKKVISGAVILYTLVSISTGFLLREPWHFIFFAGLIGLAQGAIQALSRSLFSLIIPQDMSTELFGLYNTVGRFAVVLGPLLIAAVSVFFKQMGLSDQGATRIGMSSLTLLFVMGLLLLWKVQVPKNLKVVV